MRLTMGKILPLLLFTLSVQGSEKGDYRHFLYDGMRLADNCQSKKRGTIETTGYWQKQQAKRSVYSTLQYLGLETTIKFLTLYTRHFNFTEEEFHNLGKGLIGNYCSPNITVMSRRTLKKKWIASFHRPDEKLPDHSRKNLFKNFSPLFANLEKIRKREFALTVELFKAFCSWGNDPDDPRLLVPLVRNPVIMAHVFRHLNHSILKWDNHAKELLYQTDPLAVSISCKNLICRRSFWQKYNREELNQLYCGHFRDVDYEKREATPPKIRDKLTKNSGSLGRLMSGHFISLLTLTPDLFLYAEKFSEIHRFARMPMESKLKRWLISDKHNAIDPHFTYEEQLTLDPVPPLKGESSLEIAFQINFGEWDRAVYRQGKATKVVHLSVFNNTLVTAADLDDKKPEQVIPYLKKMLEHSISALYRQIPSLPVDVQEWNTMVTEALIPLLRSHGNSISRGDARQKQVIPIAIHYSPFALQYIHRSGPLP